ncbi:MAG: hypothetical protein DVB31_08020 [Verrucomicrobia bacterium]|nr:MAG: hypothetical protein DVB31_08020 [Verrucomicrobiota bacterium]
MKSPPLRNLGPETAVRRVAVTMVPAALAGIAASAVKIADGGTVFVANYTARSCGWLTPTATGRTGRAHRSPDAMAG